jgi:hypothetical protein
VDEHTAPDEAANVLGRLIVGADPGERISVRCDWTLERGTEVRRFAQEPVPVPDGGLVIDAPFRWDDSLSPTRWTLAVTAHWQSRWGAVTLGHSHRSTVLVPCLPSWAAAVTDPGAQPAEADWRLFQADPFDIDYGELTERFGLPLQHDPRVDRSDACTVHARTRLLVPQNCTAAFSYYSSDEVEVLLDGRPLDADVTSGTPTRFYELDQRPRRTEPVQLTAGSHELTFRCAKTAELPWYQWCLAVSAVDPENGEVLLGITSDASVASAAG